MATLRRAGFGSVFEVENETVGIGTTGTATNTVQVLGETKASNALVSGISSLAIYQGFIDDNAEFGNSNIDINSQSGTLGNIEICHGDFNVSSASTLASSVNELTVTNSFSVPTGNTDSRIHCHTAGSMRFNEDLGTLEFYTGDQWRTVNSFADNGNRGRGIISSGNTGSFVTRIESIDLASQGNSTNFGENTLARQGQGGCSSNTRGIFGGGYNGPVSPGVFNTIDYVTIPSDGNAIDFGDLTEVASNRTAVSSSTRGVIGTGLNPSSGNSNVMAYVQFTTIGNALDFGDLTVKRYQGAGLNSPTRGLFAGGYGPTAVIDFITIASTGNATKFGDLTVTRGHGAGCSNSVRGLIMGGGPGANSNIKSTIDYVTIASEGNATDFGTLSTNKWWGAGVSSPTRGFIGGGYSATGTGSGSRTNVIEFVNIMSSGSAVDYGDLSEPIAASGGCSDSHGGLGGF